MITNLLKMMSAMLQSRISTNKSPLRGIYFFPVINLKYLDMNITADELVAINQWRKQLRKALAEQNVAEVERLWYGEEGSKYNVPIGKN